eukprot:gene25122-31540_t
MYCPLVVTLNLNVQLTQGKPFNQRLKMDSNESNRTLLNTGVTPSTGSSKPRKPLRQSSTSSEKSQRSASLAGDSDEETNNNNNKDRLMKSGANAQRTRKQSLTRKQ